MPAPLSKREFLLAAMSGAALASLPAGMSYAQETPRRGGVLRVACPTKPSSLDPGTGGAGTDHPFLWAIFDTLVEWDYATLKPQPGLAEWSSPDPLTLMLKLRSDKILFHDGTPLDAQAIKFNLDRNRTDARSNIKGELSSIVSVEVVSPLEVRVKLNQPDAALPAILSDRAGMMASPKAVQAHGESFSRNPVGAGPWKFVSWMGNEKVVVARNETYWRPGRPYVDGIEFLIIPDQATAMRSVTSGQNHLAYGLSPRYRPILEKSNSVKPIAAPSLYCRVLYLNRTRGPLRHLKVRQAINHAIDRKAFIRATLGGVGEPAYMLLPAAHWAYDKEVSSLYPYDPEKARRLLAEAGFEKGFELSCGNYNDQDSVRRGEVLQEMLRMVGIQLKITSGLLSEIVGQFFGTEKKFDTCPAGWTGRPDPSMTYTGAFGKDAYFNPSREASPELVNLLDESREKEDLEFRRKVFAKIQRYVMEQALAAPIAFQYQMEAVSAPVKDFQPTLLGKPKFNNVWLAG